jgi:hypothetical protein
MVAILTLTDRASTIAALSVASILYLFQNNEHEEIEDKAKILR